MKTLDDFVINDSDYYKDTFEGLRKEYFKLKKDIENLKKEKVELLDKEVHDSKLSLRDKLYLVELLELDKNSKGKNPYEIQNIIYKLYNAFSDLKEYVDINDLIDEKERRIRDILFEKITFDIRDDSGYKRFCEHQLVLVDNNLKCVCCGFSTKYYNLTEQDLELLVESAKRRGIIFNDVTKDDLPLLTILKNEREKYKKQRISIEDFEENWEMNKSDYAEELYLDDEQELFIINLQVKRAHMLDKGVLEEGNTRVSNPKYLNKEKRDKLLSKLFEDYKKLEASDTRFKELLMEEILTANYEILILSGERIPNLVENANTEQALIALSKAVYNMSRDDIRESRDYFENEKDAVFYDCLTANQKVNKKIIEMKGIKSISI